MQQKVDKMFTLTEIKDRCHVPFIANFIGEEEMDLLSLSVLTAH
jgi:hypothetical protein